jgi:hypothetical protein
MACITFATPVAMATTQVARAIRYEVSAPLQFVLPERQPLRMNWVVVTGNHGSRTLRMQWIAAEDC